VCVLRLDIPLRVTLSEEVGVLFPALPDFLRSSLEQGPLSLLNSIEELLERKSCGFGLESREYGRGVLLR
jgi:hypothetical protein